MQNAILLLLLFIQMSIIGQSQTVVKMEREGGVSIIPCKVNGLDLKFIFDTGAGDVSISLTEASFMLKNGYLKESDIIGTSNFLDANGNINEGIILNLREVEISGLKINNVKASIVKNLKAPLLLGQSAISKLGKFQMDLESNTLTILSERDTNDYSRYFQNKNLERDTTNVMSIDSLNESEYFEQGISKINLSDYQGAVADFSKVIEINPGNVEAYSNRGISKANLENYKGAIEDYSRAIELDPKDATAYFNRGLSKANLEDYNGAIADYGKTIELDPKDASGYFSRGVSKANLEDYKGAIADYSKAIELNPKNAEAYYNIGNAEFNLKDYRRAIDEFTKAISLNPKDASSYLNRGVSKFNLEDYKGAIVDYSKALELDPKNPSSYFNRGGTKDKLKDYRGAIADYNKALEISSEDADTYYERGRVKNKLRDYEGAIADYNKALEINPKHLMAGIYIEFAKTKLKETDWVYVSSSLKGDKCYMRSSYVSKNESVIKIWTKTESKKMTLQKNGQTLNYNNVKTLLLTECDCINRKSKYVSVAYYDSSGHLIQNSDEESDWKNVIPESLWEDVFEKVCESFH